MKQCSRCKKILPDKDFYKDKRTKSGLYSACKKCFSYWTAKYYREHSEIYKMRSLKQRKENPEKVRKYRRDWERRKMKNDFKFRLDKNMRWLIWYSLKKKKAGQKWEELVGYTIDDLIKHLEKQFDDKMNWENYGSYWWIDHIKPRSAFNYKSPKDKEFKECWALSNLQPLEKITNIKKSGINKIIIN